MLPAWPSCRGLRVVSRCTRRVAVPSPSARCSSRAVPRAFAPATTTSGRCPAGPLRASAGDAAPTPSPEGGAEAPDATAASEAAAPEGPMSPEDILNMVREQQQIEEALQTWQMTQEVREDPEGFYEYVDRAYAQGGRKLTSPEAAHAEEVTGTPSIVYPPAVANDIIGMGSWRLRNLIDPIISFMVPRLEGSWREILDEDICLYPRDKWKSRGWDLADSEDPKRELDGFSYADIPDPEEGAEGYPRVLIENRVYASKVFRKLHVEICWRQDGLQVLHVVLFPRYSYDLPIFGMDVVLFGDRVTLAVADLCPVRRDLRLQPHFMEAMASLQHAFFEGQDPAARRVPDWGKAIFSPLAVCISPKTEEEFACFVKYAVALHRAYLTMTRNAVPVVAGPGDRAAARRLQELLDGQKLFCEKQLANKKTRRVLEVAFGEQWTEEYMNKLMFDFDPSYEPPYFDSSYERLYEYFEENPGIGQLGMEAVGLELDALRDRSAETVAKATSGQSVSEDKVKMAMQFLMGSDPAFAAALQTLNNGEQLPPEEFLSEELMALLRQEDAAAQEG